MIIETISAVAFIIFLTLFLYIRRKNVKIQKLFYYFAYLIMYRTKLGLKLMDSMSKRFNKTLRFLSYAGIVIGFVGMVLMAFLLVQNLYSLLTNPEAMPGVTPVLPFKIKGTFYVPFFYWIISIFVIATVHEFSHGVIARVFGMKVKSSGFAFFAILIPLVPAAFVEPDEKEIKKRPKREQLSVFAAGPFSNIILGIVFLFILVFTLPVVSEKILEYDGVKITELQKIDHSIYPAEKAGLSVGEIIKGIDSSEVIYVQNLSDVLKNRKPGDKVNLVTDRNSYEIELTQHPKNSSYGYLGVSLAQSSHVKEGPYKKYAGFILWIFGNPEHKGLLYWLYMLNLGIGLFNLVPLGIVDGGRMLQVALWRFFEKKKANKIWNYISGIFLMLIIINLISGFLK